MTKKTNIRTIWINSLGLLIKKPVIMLPFLIIAFIEILTLELIYFSGRKPIAFAADPIMRKFFGEGFTHYPYHLFILPSIFNVAQIWIYIFFGAFLTAVCINIIKNAKSGLPLKPNALLRNAASRYAAFFTFGILMVLIMLALERFGGFAFAKFTHLSAKYLPKVFMKAYPFLFAILLFLANTIIQTFLIASVPLMVINKRPLVKGILESIVLGFRNFTTFFVLIFIPFLMYFPITMLKSLSPRLADTMFPEITFYILLLGIIATPFVECFVFTCITQFLIEKGEK